MLQHGKLLTVFSKQVSFLFETDILDVLFPIFLQFTRKLWRIC